MRQYKTLEEFEAAVREFGSRDRVIKLPVKHARDTVDYPKPEKRNQNQRRHTVRRKGGNDG